MTPTQEQNTIEIPGIGVQVCGPPPGGTQFVVSSTTSGSYSLPFETLSHLLSDKPLRRPNRNKPQQ